MSTELTGGAGFAYEDGVAALYLATILVEGAPPGLAHSRCERLSFQRGENNHPLDDLVVVARRQNGETVRLDLQITTSIALTEGNAKFADIVRRAWRTIDANEFSLARDRVGAAVGTVSADAARNFEFVCEAARDSVDAHDFVSRLSTWSKPRQQLVETVRKHIGGTADIADARLLLRHFVLLQFSVLGDGARDAHNAVEWLRQRTPDADTLWHHLMTIAQSAKATGGSLDSARVEERLRGAVLLNPSRTSKEDITRLKQYGRAAQESIRCEIDGYHLFRPAVYDDILAALKGARLVQIHGRPGSGKSVQLRGLADLLEKQGRPTIFLKADRLTEAGWAGLRRLVELSTPAAGDILRSLSLSGAAVILIDGIDRVHPAHRALLIEIVEALIEGAAGDDWSVVTTVRTGSLQDLANWFPLHRFQTRMDVEVKPLDDDEAKTLAEARPGLREFLFSASAIREIARRPFFLARLARLPSRPAGQVATEVDLAAHWWRYGGHDAEGETMRRRRAALLSMARTGARTLGRGVEASSIDANALDGLIQDEVVVERDRGVRVSFAHDIFFEWAFLHVLLEAEDKYSPLKVAGEPAALGRPVELLSQEMLASETEQWRTVLLQFEQQEVRSQWRRCWLLGAFQARLRPEDTAVLREVALEEEGERLERILTWSRATRTQANPIVLSQPTTTEDEAYRNAEFADLVPWPEDFPTWRRICEWLCLMADDILPRLWLDVILFFEIWQNAARDIANELSVTLSSVVQRWLVALEDHYYPEEGSNFPDKFPGLGWKDEDTLISQARQLLLGNAIGNPQAADDYLIRLKGRTSLHSSALSDTILCSHRLSRALPQAFVNFLLSALLEPLPKEELEQRRRMYEAELDTARVSEHQVSPFFTLGFTSNDDFRLDELSVREDNQQFYPAHPTREPFVSLFEHAPDEAIKLVRCIANHAIDAWRELHEIQRERRGTPIPIELSFPWGQMRFWGGTREYGMFRGTFSPHALSSGLMALEAWGLEQIDTETSVDDLLERVLPDQRNAALLGIAVSWMLYKPTPSLACLPIATHPRVWNADIMRLVQIDMTDLYSSEIGVFDQEIGTIEALRSHNRRPHRRFDVRSLAGLYLLSGDEALKLPYQTEVSRFPSRLPFELEEEQADYSHVRDLQRVAEAQATMAKADDYRIEVISSEDGKIAIHPPTVDTPHAKTAIDHMEKLNRESSVFMLVTDLLDTGEIKAGRPSRAEALLTAKALWHERKGNEKKTEIQDGTIVGMAAIVLREREKFGEEDFAWAVKVVKSTLKEPWSDDHMVPGTILTWHPLRMASAGLVGVALSSDSEARWAKRELLCLLTHPLDAVSRPALKAAFEVGDSDPSFSLIALRLKVDLRIRDDPIWPHLEQSERSVLRQRRAKDALHSARAMLNRSTGEIETLELPQAWKRLPVDPDDLEAVRFTEPDRWLESRGLHADLQAIDTASWLADERRDFLLRLAEQFTQWAVDRCEPERQGGRRNEIVRSQRDLEFLWGLARWLGILASNLPPSTAKKYFVDLLLTAPGEVGFDVVARFADMVVCAGVYDAPNIPKGVLEILMSCADRLPAQQRWSDRDYLPNGTDMMSRALLFVSVEDAGAAARFANGNYADVSSVMCIVEKVLQRVGPHPRITSYWLTLVERARPYYDTDAFICQVEQLIAAKHRFTWRGTRIPSRLANLIRYFAEEQRFSNGRMRAVLSVLDTLIDEGDRRAAAIQQSEIFRMLDRTTIETGRKIANKLS